MQTTLSRYFSVVAPAEPVAETPAVEPEAEAAVPPAPKKARVDAPASTTSSDADADAEDPLRAALERVEYDAELHARCVQLFRPAPQPKDAPGGGEGAAGAASGAASGGYEAGMVRHLPAAVRAQLTPMERTVVALKEAHADLVLLFEVGYKYKLYGEDARLARALLRVVAFVDHSFLTAMVPAVRVAFHVRRLVAAGHRVGLVRQTEVAAVKALSDARSRPFARALTDIYTPATLVGPDFDDDDDDTTTTSGSSSSKGDSDDRTLPRYILALCECDGINSESSHNSGSSSSSDDAGEGRVAFVAADLSNGEVVYDEARDDALRTGLATVFAHLRPVELLVPPAALLGAATAAAVRRHEAAAGALVTVRPAWAAEHTPARAREALARLYAESSSGGNGTGAETVLALPAGVQCCLAALAAHLAPFGLCRSLLLTATFRPFAQGRTMLLPGPTVANLELFASRDSSTRGNSSTGKGSSSSNSSTRGTLFGLVAGTRTAFGRRLLRRWLAAPLCDPERIRARQDAVAELLGAASGADGARDGSDAARAECVAQLGAALDGLPDIERGLCHIQHERCTPRELVAVLRALKGVAAALPSAARAQQCLRSALLRDTLAAIPNVYARAEAHLALINEDVAATASSPTAAVAAPSSSKTTESGSGKNSNSSSNRQGVFTDTSGFPEVVACEAAVARCEAVLGECLAAARGAVRRPALQYRHMAKEPYVLELPCRERVPGDWVKVNGTAAVTRWRTPAIAAALAALERDRALLDAATAAAWRAFLGAVAAADYGAFRDVVCGLAVLDALLALARLAAHSGYVRPEIVDPVPGGTDDGPQLLEIVDGRNPVAETLVAEPYVPNSIFLSSSSSSSSGEGEEGGGCQCAVVTGPNMGGKSCLLRQVALTAVLAQVGSFVPAARARLTPLDAIHTRMGAGDRIERGQSTYFVEMCETAPILRGATARSLVVLDELGRGTATHDGTAIAYAALCHLLKHTRALTLFVTHYSHLAAAAQTVFPARVRNYHMAFLDTAASTSSSITFLFRLVPGISPSSFGLNVARMAGIPPALIARAAAVSAECHAQQQKHRKQGAHKHELAQAVVSRVLRCFTAAQPSQGSIDNDPLDEEETLLTPAERLRAAWVTAQTLKDETAAAASQ